MGLLPLLWDATCPEPLTTSSTRNASGMPRECLPTWVTWLKRIRGALSRRQECGMADLHAKETMQIFEAAIPGWCSDMFSWADDSSMRSLKLLHSLSSDVNINNVFGTFLPKQNEGNMRSQATWEVRPLNLSEGGMGGDAIQAPTESTAFVWNFYTMIALKKCNRILCE